MRSIANRVATYPSNLEKSLKWNGVSKEKSEDEDETWWDAVVRGSIIELEG